MDWNRALFLHIGWTERYLGDEAPEGGHLYLKDHIGVEAENFLPHDGEMFGYAPVSPLAKRKKGQPIDDGNRSLNLAKLGAAGQSQVTGITVVWTARRPQAKPVIVGVYNNATVYQFMQLLPSGRHYITRAKVQDSILIPAKQRFHEVLQKRKGFPGQASAWYPGQHADGEAREFLQDTARYLDSIQS